MKRREFITPRRGGNVAPRGARAAAGDALKVGRGWGDEVNALYASAHRGMHCRRYRVRFAGAAAAHAARGRKRSRRSLASIRSKSMRWTPAQWYKADVHLLRRSLLGRRFRDRLGE